MSRRQISNVILILLPILYIILYRIYLFKNYSEYSETLSACFMAVLFTVSVMLLGFRKYKKNYISHYIFRIVLFYLCFCFLMMYGVGVFVGFLQTAYSRSIWGILNNILAPILFIILGELFRYVVIWANRDRRFILWIYTLILIFFEIILNIRSIPLGDYEALFRLFAVVIIPIFIKNVVLSYLCYYAGYKSPIVYRLVMDVYTFLVPFVPDFGEYLQCLIMISLPVIIYIHSFTLIDEREKKPEHIFTKSAFSYFDIPIFIFVAVMAALVSGIFPAYMIGIGSDSMNPKIYKGDAVILHKVNSHKTLKKGDIIAFKRNKRVVVHRINEVTKKNGEVVYVTKGDANNVIDKEPVSKDMVDGIVVMRFPFIAWPTVVISEYIRG